MREYHEDEPLVEGGQGHSGDDARVSGLIAAACFAALLAIVSCAWIAHAIGRAS